MALIQVTPAELQALGGKCKNEVTSVESVRTNITSAIASTDWQSPAAKRFTDDWNDKYVKALIDLEHALEQLGQAALSMATNYENTENAYQG